MSKQAIAVDHVSFVESVLIRPRMYTLTGSFTEAICFLEGYFSGLAKGHLSAPPVIEWSEFRSWLATRYRVSGSEIFEQMLKNTVSDRQRYEELLRLYREFRHRPI